MKFTEEDYWRNLYNQTEIAMVNNYNLFAEIAERPSIKYHPKLSIKEGRWIASYSNVEDGVIIGVGESPQEAMDDFDKEFKSKFTLKRSLSILGKSSGISIKTSFYSDSQISDITTAKKVAKGFLNTLPTIIATECIIINQDGNQFCALMGPNIQEGYAGFGDTPLHAILDLVARQSNDPSLSKILNQKPDPKHWTYKHQQKEE